MSRKFLTPIVLPADPAAAMEAATKQYVDGFPMSGTARWNCAWGVVAQGSMLEASTGAAFPAGAAITAPLTFTSVAGRRYRIHCSVRAIALTTGTGGMWLRFVGIVGVGFPDMHQYSSGQWQSIVMESQFSGDGTTQTYKVETAQAATVFFGMPTSNFYIEDVGPVAGATAIPNPTPAWIPLTFQNGFTNFNGGWTQGAYRKVGDIVECRGLIANAAAQPLNAPTTIATLPADCRPAGNVMFGLIGSLAGITTQAFLRCDVVPAGTIAYQSSATNAVGFMSLDNIRFSVTS